LAAAFKISRDPQLAEKPEDVERLAFSPRAQAPTLGCSESPGCVRLIARNRDGL
jgi:hypothetical protein